jgi:hypothetical protein
LKINFFQGLGLFKDVQGREDGLMTLTRRKPAEIFFSASFSLPKKKLSYPALLFDGQLKTLTSSNPKTRPTISSSPKSSATKS